MTAFRIAANELRRLTAGRLPRLAMVAMVLIPTLYAALYLWANHDPYGRLSHVQAALVVQDQPARTSQGKRIDVGDQVAHDLVKDGSFDWQRVDAAEARRGVQEGRYVFALRIPRGFSSALASTSRFDPARGTLELITNDANNYLSTTIAEQVISRVGRTIAERVSQQAASSFLLGFSDLHDQLQRAAHGARRLEDGAARLDTGAARLAEGASQLTDGERRLVAGQQQLHQGLLRASGGAQQLDAGTGQLADGLDTLAYRTRPLPAQTRRLAAGADQVADGNRRIAAVGDRVSAASARFVGDLDRARADIEQRLIAAGVPPAQRRAILTRLEELRAPITDVNRRVQQNSGQLDRLAAGSRQVADGARRLSDAAGPLVTGIDRADSGARQAHQGASRLADGLSTATTGSGRLVAAQQQALDGAQQLAHGADRLRSGASRLHAGAGRLADGLARGVSSIPDLTQARRQRTAQAIASPVREHNVSQASADSYGAGLAPFFLSIGAWVGAYVMFLLVRPLSNRAIAALQSPLRTAIAGWLAPALLALAQTMVMLVVVTAIVGIDVSHATQVALFLLLMAVTFVAIVHALNTLLGAPGQLLGLVLLVLQLASAGGTFPWQTLPAPLQVLHHVLPMSYTLDGLRHLMYGAAGGSVARDVLVLVGYLIGSILVSAFAARHRRVWTVSRIVPDLVL